jgi:lysophospholipase L1-like esterase
MVLTFGSALKGKGQPLLFDVNPRYSVENITEFRDPNEFIVRGGLPNFFKKIKQKNSSVKVAFLGGSITRADEQYRLQITNYIQSFNTSCVVKGINAGVPGTGSDLGACRLNEQVLQYNPDLIFVEFAVNGGSSEAMEGIVRQIRQHNATTDICFIYTIAREQYMIYAAGEIPENIKKLESIADYYQIPSVHMGLYPAVLEKRGQLIWKSVIPVDNKIVFSNDGVHPTEAGGYLYAQSIARALKKIREVEVPFFRKKRKPMFKNSLVDATMFSPNQCGTFSSGWQSINTEDNAALKQFEPWFKEVMSASNSGETYTFSFRGSGFGIFDIGGPEAGQLEIIVDGKVVELVKSPGTNILGISEDKNIGTNLLNRFNQYCNNRYRGQYEYIELPKGKHKVQLRLSAELPDKKLILGPSNLDDYTKHPEKYLQHKFYLGRILLNGKIIL